MPGSFLNYPFDEEIFVRAWHDQPDPVRLALISSGVMVEDPRITDALKNDGNVFNVPFYLPLGTGGNKGTYHDETPSSEPANYDGQTDVPLDETKGGYYTGVAYGRTQGFFERDFIPELTGADPMGLVVRKIADFWNRYRQARMMGIIEAAISNTGSGWDKHTVEIKRPVFPEKLPGMVNTALTKVFGVLKNEISVLLMDSLTASEFENINLLQFERGTNADAMLKSPRIGQMLGYTVIVDDTALGYSVGGDSDGYIYALGTGALMTGRPRLDRPVEYVRDAIKYGGLTALVTRVRDVIHPNGFKFTKLDGSWSGSPSNTVLELAANYDIVYPQQTIMLAKLELVANDNGEAGEDQFSVFIAGVQDDLDIPVKITNDSAITVGVDGDVSVISGAPLEVEVVEPVEVVNADGDELKVEVVEPVEVVNADGDELKVEVTNYEDFDFSGE